VQQLLQEAAARKAAYPWELLLQPQLLQLLLAHRTSVTN
jgi:hypothetical protein